MIFSLAKETGFDEDRLLDMPIGRLWSYNHALLRSFDCETYHITNEDEKNELYELFDRM